LLDFAIVGFPKTATTYLSEWVSNHTDHVAMHPHEVLSLQKKNPVIMVKLMHQLPSWKRRGYKSPQDAATAHVLDYFAAYWPKTPLIIGLRHPGTYHAFRLD